MTTLSLLKNVKEISDVKIKHLPLPHLKEFHKDFDWLRDEYNKWSKRFTISNPRVDHLINIWCSVMFFDCHPKERLLTIMKASEIALYIDFYLLPAREERSASKAHQIIDNLLIAVKTGKCDHNFAAGERLIESLKPLKSELNSEQWGIVEMLLENSLRAHLDIHCNYWLKNEFIASKDYVLKRGKESFWTLVIFLSEYSVHFVIPAHIRSNQLVQSFNEKIVEFGLAVDDYYVCKMKIMTNDITSRMVCLLNEKGCTLQEAFDNQFEYTMDLYKQCNDLRDKINGNPEIASEKLSASMKTSFNDVFGIFRTTAEGLQIEVNDDLTIHSSKWEQTYNELVLKAKSSVDPWSL